MFFPGCRKFNSFVTFWQTLFEWED
jgi:hypothetical protein